MKKYLYWNYNNEVKRSEITKETDLFYWLLDGNRVSKATMKCKLVYSSQKFQVETPKLLERYLECVEIAKYNDKLRCLATMFGNAEIRTQVLSIDTFEKLNF